jgi:hypothetical protein
MCQRALSRAVLALLAEENRRLFFPDNTKPFRLVELLRAALPCPITEPLSNTNRLSQTPWLGVQGQEKKQSDPVAPTNVVCCDQACISSF